jgi:hypothetical protein
MRRYRVKEILVFLKFANDFTKDQSSRHICKFLLDSQISLHMLEPTSIIVLEENDEKHVKYPTAYM